MWVRSFRQKDVRVFFTDLLVTYFIIHFCLGGWRLLVVRVLCLLPMPNQGTHLHHSVHALYLDENPKRRRGFLHTVHQLFLSQKLDIVCLLVRARQSLCLVEALLLSMKSRGAQC